LGITQTAIEAQLATGAGDENQRLAALQGALKCGTNCGSCLPELRRKVSLAIALPRDRVLTV
jgi:assimilatory nitrate reductase catalytic subunit